MKVEPKKGETLGSINAYFYELKLIFQSLEITADEHYLQSIRHLA